MSRKRWVRGGLLAVLLQTVACQHGPAPEWAATASSLRLPAPPASEPRSALPGRSLVVRDALLLDGQGGPPQEGMDLWIEEGLIQAIGPDLEVPDRPELDASGMTLLPGLITAHAHLQSVPGSVLRGDDRAAVERQQELQLRSYLASGFTTVLDPAMGPETARRLQELLRSGYPGPALHLLAPFVTPAEGYMTAPEMRGQAFADFWPPFDDSTDLDALMAAGRALSPVGVKVAIEDGIVFPNFNTFSPEDLEAIRQAAAAHQLPVYVHSIDNKDHLQALTLDPHALVHVGLWTEAIDPFLLSELRRRGTYVMSTVTLNHLAHWGWSQSFVDDPWIRARVPVLQWETAAHPDTPRRLTQLSAEIMRPSWIPGWLARLGAPLFIPSEREVQETTASGVRAIAALEEAGIPWVLGADEGNSPAYTTFFHAVSSQIELEQLDAGGIPREAILQACTRRPAEMIGIADRAGTLEPGKQADLILLRDNPLEEGMVALRSLQWVIRAGEARTPSAWLADP